MMTHFFVSNVADSWQENKGTEGTVVDNNADCGGNPGDVCMLKQQKTAADDALCAQESSRPLDVFGGAAQAFESEAEVKTCVLSRQTTKCHDDQARPMNIGQCSAMAPAINPPFSWDMKVKEISKNAADTDNKNDSVGQVFCPDQPIYLDYSATTPCDPRVVEVMLPLLTQAFGNPHSRNHAYGWQAEQVVQQARQQLGECVNAEAKDIIWTSGATEANNLALKGAAYFRRDGVWGGAAGTDPACRSRSWGHLITVATEHKCILETVRALEEEGCAVTVLPVQADGLVDLDQLARAFRPDTFLVSIGAVNGEIGVIQPLQEIGALCRQHGAYFHTDAAQALGKIPLDVQAMHIDLMSVSSHKVYGPKGVGALYVRRRPRVRLRALLHGGGQERGLRSGTVPPFLCAGFAHAAKLAVHSMAEENQRLQDMRDWLWSVLSQALPDIVLNGHPTHRVANNLNISFFGVEGEGLMMGLPELALSSGSACTSASLEPSYVLRALGVSDAMAHTSLRLTLGRWTTWNQVRYAADALIAAVRRLRDLSPLWDLHQQGIDLDTIQWIAH